MTPPTTLQKNYPGTYNGAYANGQVGQAFDLNGISNYADFSGSSNLNLTTAISVDAWISPDTTTGNYQTIVSKWSQGNSSWGLFIVGSGGTAGLYAFNHEKQRRPDSGSLGRDTGGDRRTDSCCDDL